MRNSGWRSEEHTSELQSRENLVCRLLLGKKNEAVKSLIFGAEGMTKLRAVGVRLRRLSMSLTCISRHNSTLCSDTLVLTSVTPASSPPVLQAREGTSSPLYCDSLTVKAGIGGFLHCIPMDRGVNAANQVVSLGADVAFDADPNFFSWLLRPPTSTLLPSTPLFR